jgi:hypothetical protein
MTKTVHDLRNDIREATGRYERIESTSFTKEALVAICDAVDADIDTATTPPKAEMRAAVLAAVGVDGDAENPFRKAELQAIADALGVE